MEQIVELLNEWGIWGLMITTFLESSFFPIIPETFLIPMAIANPDKAIFYALITTVSSVLGAFLGYFIGVKVGKPILKKLVKDKTIKQAEAMFEKYGTYALAFAGFTPVPYKVFTILSGVLRISLVSLVVGSLIGRGFRFFLEAIVIVYFGEKAMTYITEYSVFVTGGIGVVILLLVIVFYEFEKRPRSF